MDLVAHQITSYFLCSRSEVYSYVYVQVQHEKPDNFVGKRSREPEALLKVRNSPATKYTPDVTQPEDLL